MRTLTFCVLTGVGVGVASFGCSDSDESTSASIADSGIVADASDNDATADAGDAAVEVLPAEGTLSGSVVDNTSGDPVMGATINVGGQTATADAMGAFSVKYATKVPSQLVITKDGYYSFANPEWTLIGDAARITPIVSDSTAGLLTQVLTGNPPTPPRDEAKGYVIVSLSKAEGCASVAGATITISDSGATGRYFGSGGLPDTTLTSALDNTDPAIAFYNVAAGPVTVTVTHPTCKAKAFPIDFEYEKGKGAVRLTGNINVIGGNTLNSHLVVMGN